jgi:hypothetical protein
MSDILTFGMALTRRTHVWASFIVSGMISTAVGVKIAVERIHGCVAESTLHTDIRLRFIGGL